MRVLAPWLLIALVAALPQAAIAGSAVPKVLVTVAPLKPYADALLAGIGESSNLLNASQDPHTLALTPSQMRVLSNASIILTPDRDMHPALADLLDRREAEGALILSLTSFKQADALPYPAQQAWLGEADEGHDHEKESALLVDPHVWLDPLRMAALAEPLAEAIGKKAPSQQAQLLYNAKTLAQHLRTEVEPALAQMLKTRSGTPKYKTREYLPFVTAHRAYQYFFARFGIDDPGSLVSRPEEYIGARSMRDALKRASELSIGCVVAEQDAGWARKIAQLGDSKVVVLQPEQLPARGRIYPSWAKNDYDKFLETIARGFAPCI